MCNESVWPGGHGAIACKWAELYTGVGDWTVVCQAATVVSQILYSELYIKRNDDFLKGQCVVGMESMLFRNTTQ